MASNFKVLQVIPKLGFGGAETGCYDIAHFLAENECKSIIVTSGGPLIKYVRKQKVKIIDNNSTNGIYINNEIKSEHELKSGDKIQIGKYLLLLTEVTK